VRGEEWRMIFIGLMCAGTLGQSNECKPMVARVLGWSAGLHTYPILGGRGGESTSPNQGVIS
jgi:hypothetical protein